MDKRKFVGNYSTFEQEYIELIYSLLKKSPVARIKDIAKLRDVASPTVTVAVDRLRKAGLVEHEKSGYVVLTEEGMSLAQRLERRHRLIYEFLHKILKVPADIAETDACNIEHILDKKSVDNLEKFLDYMEKTELSNKEWMIEFQKTQ